MARYAHLTTAAQVPLPSWLPADLRDRIERHDLPDGVTRQQGELPWGDIVVWVAKPGAVQHVEIYQEFPGDERFYLDLSNNDAFVARVLTDVYTQYNRDMRYFVDEKGYSPHLAHNELRRINDEVFRLVIGAAGDVYAAGFDLGAFKTVSKSINGALVDAAERTAFSPRGKLPLDAALPVPGPMPERLTSGIVSQAPPTRVVGEVVDGASIVRKTVATDTLLGRTRFGRMWGAESIRAQEAALMKLEAAGIETARIRQSFSDTGELILDYAGKGVDAEWATMGSEAQQAFGEFVWYAKHEMGVVHDLKRRNIAYQRIELDGQVFHRFVVFDPAFDRYSILVAIVGAVPLGVIGTITAYAVAKAIGAL